MKIPQISVFLENKAGRLAHITQVLRDAGVNILALSLAALVLFGGEAIRGFAVVMLCGVVICTYSAIFVSTPVLIYLGLQLSGARSAAGRAGVPQPAE